MKENNNNQANQNEMKRWTLYLLGLLTLAVGIVLNTKTTLGVSPIISVAYCCSVVTGHNLGNLTFILYFAFVLIEIVLHLIMKKKYDIIIKDLLQIVLSLVFTRFMNLFAVFIPTFETDLAGTIWGSLSGRLFFLAIAIILTGIGAAMSLNAHLIPNPGDGVVQAIAEFSGKTVGFIKNCVDITCVACSFIIGMLAIHTPAGIGIGTVLAMIFVGRVVAVYNKLTHQR